MYWINYPTGDSQLYRDGRRIAALYRVRSANGSPPRWEAVAWGPGTKPIWGRLFDDRSAAKAELEQRLGIGR